MKTLTLVRSILCCLWHQRPPGLYACMPAILSVHDAQQLKLKEIHRHACIGYM